MGPEEGVAPEERAALAARHPRRLLVPLLLGASAVLYGFGLLLPIFSMERIFREESTYSVLGGVVQLAKSGQWLLAVLISAFSVAFPAVKLAVLAWLWFAPAAPARRARTARVLEALGRWSMLDVLVVILLAGSIRLGILASARVEFGAYPFAASILLAMVAARRVARTPGVAEPRSVSEAPRSRHPHLAATTLLALACLTAALVLPLLRVGKWIVVSREFSIVSGFRGLVEEGSPVLAAGFLLFVGLIPLAAAIAQVLLAFLHLAGGGGRAAKVLLGFESFGMTDVFALALLLTVLRLKDVADVELRIGIPFYAAAVLLATYSAVRLRRLYSTRGSPRSGSPAPAPR